MRGITRESARLGVGVIRTQSRESRDPERGRWVKIGFLDTDKVNGMEQIKVKHSSAPGLKTTSIPLKNPGELGGEEAGGVEGQPEARSGGGGQRGIRGLKTRVWWECSISRGKPDCTVEV